MIKRLLVANRSEIAVRIMARAAVLGIETVEVTPPTMPPAARPPAAPFTPQIGC